MKGFLGMIVLTVLVMGQPALGQIYQYRDKAGRLHFTDDLTRVPEAQRPADALAGGAPPAVLAPAAAVEDAQPEPEAPPPGADSGATAAAPEGPASVPEESAASQSPTDGGAAAGEPAAAGGSQTIGAGETRTPPDRRVAVQPTEAAKGEAAAPADGTGEALEARNAALKKEFQELMAEKDRLEQDRIKAKSNEQRRALSDLVKQYNQKVEAYESKRNQLNDEISAHNEVVMQRAKERAKKP
jgi:hypothetical protein